MYFKQNTAVVFTVQKYSNEEKIYFEKNVNESLESTGEKEFSDGIKQNESIFFNLAIRRISTQQA